MVLFPAIRLIPVGGSVDDWLAIQESESFPVIRLIPVGGSKDTLASMLPSTQFPAIRLIPVDGNWKYYQTTKYLVTRFQQFDLPQSAGVGGSHNFELVLDGFPAIQLIPVGGSYIERVYYTKKTEFPAIRLILVGGSTDNATVAWAV